MGGACSTEGRKEMCIQGYGGDLRKSEHLEDPDVVGSIILRWIFKKWDGTWTEAIWFRIGTGGGHLQIR
jgi:hypothetical protein